MLFALAITWVVLLHVVGYTVLWSQISNREWVAYLILGIPFADSSLLGLYLVTGVGKPWLRLLLLPAGVCLSLLVFAFVDDGYLLTLLLSQAVTAAIVAFMVLFYGALAGSLNLDLKYKVRFSLWEIIATVSVLASIMGAVRLAMATGVLDMVLSGNQELIPFLFYSAFSGIYLSVSIVALLVRSWKVQILAMVGTVLVIAASVPVEAICMRMVVPGDPEYQTLYGGHLTQLFFCWLTMFPLRHVLVRLPKKTQPELEASQEATIENVSATLNH